MRWMILALAFLNVGFAVESKSLAKKYVQLDQMNISKEGIYIQSKDHWIKVPSLYYDAEGFYIRTAAWQCPVCSNWNYDAVKNCEDCTYGR